jgi:hypothetical protein
MLNLLVGTPDTLPYKPCGKSDKFHLHLKGFLLNHAEVPLAIPIYLFFTSCQFRPQSQSAALTMRTEFDPFLIFLAMFSLLTS